MRYLSVADVPDPGGAVGLVWVVFAFVVFADVFVGAGQDVGRSCVLVSVGGKNVMFDCGMHMGYNDERRFPDFSYISKTHNFDQILDCVIITHL